MSFDVDVARRLGDTDIAVRFAVGEGLTVLLGPSGAGKSSVLNMIAGLLRPDSGHVRLSGDVLFDAASRRDVAPEHRRFGYIFQDARLFPHLRVRANLLFGYRLAAPSRRWITLDDVVAFLGISHLLDRWPRSLSGGETQRVAIGRALLAAPRALLMDEPLSSLDVARRDEILLVIERVRDELRLPILYVTHNPAEAERLATQSVRIDAVS